MDKLNYLKKLVEIKSFDTTQNTEIIDYLQCEFNKIAVETLRIKNALDARENLLVGLNCNLKNLSDAVVLAGHIDTVTADEKLYNTCPYKAVLKDGKLYGLGSIDMKSFFAVVLNNAAKLKQLPVPVVVAITGDEETNLNGVVRVVDTLKQLNITPKCTIVGEPTDSDICSQSKSCYEFRVQITGKSCHSSNPSGGVNANYIAARIMLKIEELCTKYPDTTTTCNIVSGGEKVNIISNSARLSFDVRTLKIKYKDAILNDLNDSILALKQKYNGCDIKVENALSIPPLEKNNPELIKSLCTKYGVNEKLFQGGCEAGYYQALGGDAIVCGVGDLKLAHKPNEFAIVDEFEKYSDRFVSFICDFAAINIK